MYNVENFITEAINLDIKNIKIIHGRNGGVLRKAVHEYLKHNKNVESYRLGNYYEGSYGVTIIKLNSANKIKISTIFFIYYFFKYSSKAFAS